MRRHPTAEKNIQIGSLIAIKTKAEKHWSLGVVRWANCGARDKLDIGVQLIAPRIKSATARIDKGIMMNLYSLSRPWLQTKWAQV